MPRRFFSFGVAGDSVFNPEPTGPVVVLGAIAGSPLTLDLQSPPVRSLRKVESEKLRLSFFVVML
jgi:hypothetical protein